MVFLIGYKKRVGKDTTANLLTEMLPNTTKKSFATPLKEIVSDMFGISVETLDNLKNTDSWLYEGNDKFEISFRKILQRFGNGKIKHYFGRDVWAKLTLQGIKENVIVADFRFPEEYEVLKEYHKVVSIKVERDIDNFDEDESENALNTFKFDYTIDNSGNINHLKNQLRDILKEIKDG